jgi:predicted enzyme related to lactoylglutathione lyase
MNDVIPNYIELTTVDLSRARAFYTEALACAFTDYGPDYAAVEGGPTEVGFRVVAAPTPPMPLFESKALEETLAHVERAGGRVVSPITPYPGGRRFEFLDPDGHRIGVYQRV